LLEKIGLLEQAGVTIPLDAASLGEMLGPSLNLIESHRHEHRTPGGAPYSDSNSSDSNVTQVDIKRMSALGQKRH
jgi:hypothetical protein